MSIIDVNRDSWNKQTDRYQKNATFSVDEVDYGDSSCPKEKDLKLISLSLNLCNASRFISSVTFE